MNSQRIQKMQRQFDEMALHFLDKDIEFWFACELQKPLGYVRWENFFKTIQRAIDSCQTVGYEPLDHFRGVTKMVTLGSGAQREIEDFIQRKILRSWNGASNQMQRN